MSPLNNQSPSRPQHSVNAEQATTLVFGASGYIGSNLVNFLVERGEKVRAVARNLAVLAGRQWQGVECMAADALSPDSLAAALRQVDTACYLVHSMAAGANFGELDMRAAENFRDAASAAGIRRIIYLGGLIPEQPESEHLRSRQETGEVLRRGSVPVTELRAGMIVGPCGPQIYNAYFQTASRQLDSAVVERWYLPCADSGNTFLPLNLPSSDGVRLDEAVFY